MSYDIVVGRNETDKKKLGEKGLIYIGKGFVKMGQYNSLSNKIFLDVARSHVILVAGKRGCLTEDTMIFSDKGYKKIKDFDEKKDKIFSFDKEKEKFEWETAKLLEYPIKNENLLQIELDDGRIINLTNEHPLLSSYGKYKYYRRACDLKVKDKIVLPTKIPEIKKDNESLRIARLLGFILSDGTINIRKGIFKDGRGKDYKGTKARIRIYNQCEEVLVQAKEDFEKEFDVVAKRVKRNDCNCEIIETKHQRIVNKFIDLGVPKGDKSGIIRIPKIVFQSSNKFKSEFISSLFDCDGYVPKKGRYIDYSSKSRKFLEDLQILLTHFNIESVIRKKNAKLKGKIFENYRLFITDNLSVENFKKKIKLLNPFKQKRLEEHKSNGTRKRKTHYPSENLVCLKIKEIRKLKNIKKVYDLTVDKNHSFIANGIISHNSGKSYTMGVLTEEISNLPKNVSENISSLIFDTMGIYWTMKYSNEKDKNLLRDWDLQPKNSLVKIFVPFGAYDSFAEKGIPVDEKFALDVSEMTPEDWIITFGLNLIDPVSILITRTLLALKEKGSYTIKDIIESIEKDKKSEREVINAASGLFEAADGWGIFARDGMQPTKVRDLVTGGLTSILDLSVYNSIGAFNVRALVISLVSRKLFNERMMARKTEEIKAVSKGFDLSESEDRKETPLIWLFIDECLTGDTKIKTNKGEFELKKIINNFPKEKYKVLSYNEKEKKFEYEDIKKTYKKGKRKIIKIITETGREIKCTPEHRVLTKQNVFASVFSVNNLAFPLIYNYSIDKKIIEARILGHLFGDGWITDKQQSIGFSGKGNKNDLEKIRKDLKELGFSSTNIYERKTNSKINHKGKEIIVKGTSQSFTSNRSAYKFFRKKAEFSGIKSIHPTKIPKWLIKASKEEKAEFLSALMGSDGQTISKTKNAKGDFNAIRFSFNKLEALEKEAFEFANQIKFLFESLGIKISNISKKEGNLKKDGNKTIKIVITLKKEIKNTIRFLEKVGYRYCLNKEIQGLKYLEYLKARVFIKEQREKIYKKAIELHKKEGYGKTKISKLLNFPEAQIRDWIYLGIKPGLPKNFFDFEEWIKKREKGNILYENIYKIEEVKEEEVYDLSVNKTHNFISNGFITHNCHEFLPKDEKIVSTDALVQILREGRQPGISLVLATQQPGKIHTDVMTQSDVVLAHRVTSKPDVEALNAMMQSYLTNTIQGYMNDLPGLKGSAIILDDNSERIYPMRVRPRYTWHGGEAPTAVSYKKEF